MNDVENIENELSPRLRQMLMAYGITPKRDPELSRRTRARFMAELDQIDVEPTPSGSISEILSSNFNQLKQYLTRSPAQRSMLYLVVALIVVCAYLFGGMGITAYAASSSLPGDPLYSFKTAIESARANLTLDSADQTRLYLNFAGSRVFEIQSLIGKDRYSDIPRATSEFERDIQESLAAIDRLSRANPAQAARLEVEIIPILQSYRNNLTQMLSLIPANVRPALQNAIDAVDAAVGNHEDDNAINPTPAPTVMATPADVVPTPAPSSAPIPSTGGGDDNNDENSSSGNDSEDDDNESGGSDGGGDDDDDRGGDDDGDDDESGEDDDDDE
jgi:hypothetical protein